MSKYCFVILLLFASAGFAQKPDDTPQDMQMKGVLITGINLSQVDGDECYGFYKIGLNTGVGAILPLGKNFSLSLETLYNQKGSYKKYPPERDSTGVPYYKLKLDYLDVPLMLYYEDRHVWTFGLGFSWGRLVNKKEIIRGKDTVFSQYTLNGTPVNVSVNHVPGGDTVLTTYPLLKNDWSFIAGIHFRIWKHLKFNIRYNYSFVNFGSRQYINRSGATWTRKLYHNMITLRLMYILNERYVPPPREKKSNKKKTTAYIPEWN